MEIESERSQVALNKINLNRCHGYGEAGHECGYCKAPEGSVTCGFSIETNMSVKDYRILNDRGFRRCGAYFYKPNLARSCCKMFTIRSDAEGFKMRKSHAKIWKRWKKFLLGERDFNCKDKDVNDEDRVMQLEESSKFEGD